MRSKSRRHNGSSPSQEAVDSRRGKTTLAWANNKQPGLNQQQAAAGAVEARLLQQHAAQQQHSQRTQQHPQHINLTSAHEQQAAAPVQGATPLASGGSRRYNLGSSAKQRASYMGLTFVGFQQTRGGELPCGV
jgi:hypothetical protein